MLSVGKVTLVGAGPGDPDLLTVKALRCLGTAETVVYDRLVSAEILDLIPARAEMIPVGKRPRHHPVSQTEINALLVRLARSGRDVIRLKGGDPFIFGRGSEETAALIEAGIPFAVVPGITAAQGASASTGVPLTHRGLAHSVRYITGHCRADRSLDFDWPGLADAETTLVVYMAHASIGDIARALIGNGLPATTPVLAVARATQTDEECRVSTLGAIANILKARPMDGPLLFVIGRVAGLYPQQIQVLPSLLAVASREVVHA